MFLKKMSFDSQMYVLENILLVFMVVLDYFWTSE